MRKLSVPGKIAAEAVKNLFRKPATLTSSDAGELSPKLRGLISWNPENCVACGMCMRDCPTGAIKIVNEGTREEKKLRGEIDTGRCIFCCQCVDSCAKKCITNTAEYELHADSREGLKRKL